MQDHFCIALFSCKDKKPGDILIKGLRLHFTDAVGKQGIVNYILINYHSKS